MTLRATCCLAVLLIVGLVTGGADETPEGTATKSLVLRDGTTVAVTRAEVKGSYVHFVLANGRMQAYPIEDVDLEGSGLLPGAADPAAQEEEQAARKPRTLSDATVREDTAAVFAITDADVEHIYRESPEAEGEGDDRVKLAVSDIRKTSDRGVLKLTAVVENNSPTAVGGITIIVTALDQEEKSSGTGRASIAEKLEPGKKAGFSVEFPTTGPVFLVDIDARGLPDKPSETPKPPPEAGEKKWWEEQGQPGGTEGGEGAEGSEAPPPEAPRRKRG